MEVDLSKDAFITLTTLGFTFGGIALVIGAMLLNEWLDGR